MSLAAAWKARLPMRTHPGSAQGKPLLLLDVDGTLSPLPKDGAYPTGTEWLVISDMWGGIYVDARLPRWLEQLSERFEIAWATTWEDTVDALEPGLGLGRLPHISFRGSPSSPQLFGPGSSCDKLPAVAEFISDQPAAWVDDHISAGARAWAKGRESPTLFVRTAKYRGITRRQVNQLLRWAEQLDQK